MNLLAHTNVFCNQMINWPKGFPDPEGLHRQGFRAGHTHILSNPRKDRVGAHTRSLYYRHFAETESAFLFIFAERVHCGGEAR